MPNVCLAVATSGRHRVGEDRHRPGRHVGRHQRLRERLPAPCAHGSNCETTSWIFNSHLPSHTWHLRFCRGVYNATHTESTPRRSNDTIANDDSCIDDVSCFACVGRGQRRPNLRAPAPDGAPPQFLFQLGRALVDMGVWNPGRRQPRARHDRRKLRGRPAGPRYIFSRRHLRRFDRDADLYDAGGGCFSDPDS